jgi:hypothetical protein
MYDGREGKGRGTLSGWKRETKQSAKPPKRKFGVG